MRFCQWCGRRLSGRRRKWCRPAHRIRAWERRAGRTKDLADVLERAARKIREKRARMEPKPRPAAAGPGGSWGGGGPGRGSAVV